MSDFNINELMQQAKKMQEQMQKAQEEAAKRTVTGESGAGMVKVQLGGRYDARRVELSDELMTEDKEIIEDLIVAAINDAVKKLDDGNKDSMSQMAAGMKLPDGFKFPF
ncbi:YbaB/EbfC family nucleoid-associated protein [Pseudohongiella sp. SYSU M77423]|uniref:YbaB/EbfC family nucleoid-associated protein n=1 Tax=unclassified Pseudohongiella TaxID=2629611 RepID=UPI000C5CE7D1|nr:MULTISPECIES: YbaB/EbfC family nucleoid-associated protein [unclassified Pseudohongiella]MAO39453.1 YbaB/EbfC family nucleoid-associated protein [Pseudohongiella sp.]MAY56512.1 YbaB/EbfC family nucleoid-associated protein [Gammaproteobacteria bacterium]MEC8860090.1 YbaB/EbfC family nucleoid-associated protein [Pseudomonadota bacterium]MBJ56387.1 YbaB/EbfC family nucleoid-associated protein [Gammaproteobacteria bacterium]MDH7943182.1 YbaB/EbfC family nucleoid-associated protein [Pseudohongie|tara:strand:- start:226 stop:552 length:327 start_codon:yes stop_codon:yes gene_type:complete